MAKREKEPLVWNVYIGDTNGRCIKVHNIFNNTRFVEECREATKKCKDDKDAFISSVKRSLMYYYWSKCEWEIIIDNWPPRDDFKSRKVDVYEQVILNWPVFTDWLWEHRKDL